MKKNLMALTVILSFAAVSVVHGQSAASAEASLKLTHETLTNTIKLGNLTQAQALIHPRAVGFFWDSQMLVELSSEYGPTQALPAVLADLTRFASSTYSTTYRAIGDTGIVVMTSTRVPKEGAKTPDGKKEQTRYLRLTYVYAQSGGNWKLVSWHSSQTPLKAN